MAHCGGHRSLEEISASNELVAGRSEFGFVAERKYFTFVNANHSNGIFRRL